MEIKIKLIADGQIPVKATENSACYDVFARAIEKSKDDFVIVKVGFSLEMPIDYKCVLVPRSSLTGTHWILQNSPGQGDTDFRGEYQYRFRALPIDFVYTPPINTYGPSGHSAITKFIYPDFPYKVGERIGQIYFDIVNQVNFTTVNELSDTVRGTGGFGSTGK
jgi:dUTP pyrophosphatase